MLVGQGLGLGGWIHAAVFSPYILQRVPEKGWCGLGFRMEPPREPRRRWPPTPASQPNPVGIDGVLEGLCPPYVKTMDEAVDRVIEEKYGAPGPCYGDTDLFARAYRRREDAEAYLRNAMPFSPEAIRYAKEICIYVHETYGRFPAHVDAFYTPGVWLRSSTTSSSTPPPSTPGRRSTPRPGLTDRRPAAWPDARDAIAPATEDRRVIARGRDRPAAPAGSSRDRGSPRSRRRPGARSAGAR
jgi:hypothetical protein